MSDLVELLGHDIVRLTCAVLLGWGLHAVLMNLTYGRWRQAVDEKLDSNSLEIEVQKGRVTDLNTRVESLVEMLTSTGGEYEPD